MRFSQRKNIQPVEIPVQIKSIDAGLRNGLWSAISVCFFDAVHLYDHTTDKCSHSIVLMRLWHNYFKLPLDEYPKEWRRFITVIKDHFFQCEWYEVYDFIECLLSCFEDKDEEMIQAIVKFMNNVMERDNCGFRIIDKKIADLTDEHTKESIERSANQTRYSGASVHIKSAIRLLYDRTSPDYRNSIKESISAVESACNDFCDLPKATLGHSIKKMEDLGHLHPALRDAMSKLYGYTSDEGGIRHAIIDHSTTTKDDAVFMLSVCSAYINYIISKS